jgi:putative two-component system response regulator
MAFDQVARAQMERLMSDFGRVYRERNEALQELEQAHHQALMRLAVAAELRDGDTGVHIVRLGYLAEALALHLGQDPAWARQLRLAAPMHDVGKIGIADSVLKKPGPLTPAERAEMQQHPRMGAEILGHSTIPLFQLAADVALNHHERWNGSGYPAGLSGDAIPLAGRIVAVVDFVDALTMDRCYRSAFADEMALVMLAEQSGQHFDPDVVNAFIDHTDEMLAVRDWVNRTQPGFGEIANDRLCPPRLIPQGAA